MASTQIGEKESEDPPSRANWVWELSGNEVEQMVSETKQTGQCAYPMLMPMKNTSNPISEMPCRGERSEADETEPNNTGNE